MDLLLMRHLWGGVAEPWEQTFPKFQAAGYHGIDELPPDTQDRDRFRQLLPDYGFTYYR